MQVINVLAMVKEPSDLQGLHFIAIRQLNNENALFVNHIGLV